LKNLEVIKRLWEFMGRSIRRVMQYTKNATINLGSWMITLGLFLILLLTLTTTSCQSLPSEGINIAYPIRPANPVLLFKDKGKHCISDKELRRLGTFYIDSGAYFEKTEAIIDAVNGK